ncbi:hypothetical protein SLEP1_g48419 [Rubroshorea leprosula]|uniref:Integrase catalytic domain-containing protein n=1 Tax=Rubroshorea leprosula TaxID=152421 RepID=A0AAV5LVN1_9ROSI|nr:hypothetical protein SLEP1_g48419 [Rubroshorea leprosula]
MWTTRITLMCWKVISTTSKHFRETSLLAVHNKNSPTLQMMMKEHLQESARTSELEERTRVLEITMGKILSRLNPDDPLILLLNMGEQPAAVVATCNSLALSNVVVPTIPKGSGKLNPEPNSSRHNEELLKKNADLERQLKDVQKSIDELKSPRSRQQALDLDSAPLNLSITAEPYQEGFKIPHLETYDVSGDSDEHLHTYQAIMRIQNATDAMMCKVFPATLKSMARRCYHKLPRHSIASYSELATLFSNKFPSQREIKHTTAELMQVHQKEGKSLRDYMQWFNKSILDIDNVPDTICLSALLHGLKPSRFLDDLLENPPKSWNEIQHWVKRPPPQTHDFSRADRSKYCNYHHGYGHNTEDCQSLKDELEFLARNKKLEGIPPPSGTINMISGGMHSGGQSARGHKAYARQVMTKMQLNPSSLQKYEGPIYGFDNQPVSVEGVITLPIYVGSEPRFRIASVNFLVVKMESAFNAILGRTTLYELKTMSISDIEHRPEGVEQKAEPVEPVEAVPLNPDILERTVKVGTKLLVEEGAELLGFLRANQDVFVWTTDEMPGIPTELSVAIDEEIQKLLQAGFIKRVEYSKWVSNPVLVKKPNGKWRMCIDFTNLNEACPKDPHPLLNVEKLVERAAGHERMSFLDASSGYHQIGRNIEVYVDDMIVTSKRAEDHIDDLNETFQNLRRAQMKLNPLKCTFAVESGKFLGYVVSKKGIEVNPEKVQAVQQMEPPKTVKDVQRLTGRVAALHRFIAKLQAFDELKQYLVSAPLLSKPMEGESLYLYLGVIEEAVSSVLLREENKHQKPICYINKIPKVDNQRADELSKLASSQDINPQRSTIMEVLDAPSYTDFTVECQLLSTDPSSPSWTTPLVKYLRSGELPEDPSTSKLGVDLLDPFVKSKGGCTYLVVAVDYFTKCIEAKPLSTTTEKIIEEFLFNSILYMYYLVAYTICTLHTNITYGSAWSSVYMFGIPKRIIADNGPRFRAAALKSFYNDYGIELALTYVYTPQSNGQAESTNKIVLRGLKTRVLATHSNWVDELNRVLWSCRTTPSSTTGETPFSLANGAEAVIPVEVELPSDRVARHNDLSNEQLLRENLDLIEEVREMSRIRNMAHQSRVARFYNKRVQARQFQVGDLVLRKAGINNAYAHMGKLAPNWEGPYMVICVKRPGSYQLVDLQGRHLPFIWNIHNFRKFYS